MRRKIAENGGFARAGRRREPVSNILRAHKPQGTLEVWVELLHLRLGEQLAKMCRISGLVLLGLASPLNWDHRLMVCRRRQR